MTDKEHRDIYIAAGVGGVALILILLYVHSAPPPAAVAGLPSVLDTPSVDTNPYNYNVAPYGGSGPLNIPANGRSGSDLLGTGNGGCCDPCDKSGGYQNPGVSAFLRLMAMGA